MGLQLLRGNKTNKPTLNAGEVFVALDTNEFVVGLGNNCDISMPMSKVNDIGTPGSVGFGVGIAPYVPSYIIPLPGTFSLGNDQYGNYKCVIDNSIVCWIPKHYERITNVTAAPYYGTKADVAGINVFANEAAANLLGYFLPRSFVDGGVIKDGFFVDKVKWSLTNFVYNSTGIASSILNSNPVTSSADANRNASNLFAGSFSNFKSNGQSPADNYGGAWAAAKSRGNDFAVCSMFIHSTLAFLSLAHGQASISNANNAWYDPTGVNNFPKGNNNSGADINDSTCTFSVCDDSYWASLNCARKNGSGSIFAKITHNGQNCGVADLNGNQYEISQGFTNIGGVAGGFLSLKESIALMNVTGGAGGANDHFSNATIFNAITLPTDLTGATGWTYFGNSTNQIFSGITDRTNNAYLLTALGLPQLNGSGSGINMMGNDGLYKFILDQLCPILGGYWNSTTYAGVWYVALYNLRATAATDVSGRSCLYV